MDSHRKLLVLATNELLKRNLISLDSEEDARGHVMATIAGENAVIMWRGIGWGELEISVWWKYDHAHHPQANLEGNAREEFKTSSPLAKRQHYPKFVGVTVSGWIERKTTKHLQGKKHDSLFAVYTRRGEKETLDALPDPIPDGFKAEGKFFM